MCMMNLYYVSPIWASSLYWDMYVCFINWSFMSDSSMYAVPVINVRFLWRELRNTTPYKEAGWMKTNRYIESEQLYQETKI